MSGQRQSMTVAIVGAGIAGLACAKRLEGSGFQVALFDKGRRPGGRLSTLRIDQMAWDFGAQYLRVHHDGFAQQVAAWRQQGLIADWLAGPAGALVGVPAMATIVEAQCAQLPVRFGAQVQRIERDDQGAWHVQGVDLREGPFDGLILAIPAEQAVPLIALHDLAMAQDAAAAPSHPCWTVMVAFDAPLPCAAVVRDAGAIVWACRNNSKPARGSAECWVIQADPIWSRENLERLAEDVAVDLLALFGGAIGCTLPPTRFLKAHRWRFAMSGHQRGGPVWNAALRLGTCGDWTLAPCIEGAWQSGVDLADRIDAHLSSVARTGSRRAAAG